MPMPKPVCRASLNHKWVQLEVCRTFLGGGMGMNITAHVGIRGKPNRGSNFLPLAPAFSRFSRGSNSNNSNIDIVYSKKVKVTVVTVIQ